MITQLLDAPGGVFFGVLIAIVLGLILIEVLAAFMGGNPIDAVIPDFAADMDLGDMHDGLELHGAGANFLAWLHVGRVPIVILLALLLASWGGIGLALQHLSHALIGSYAPAWILILVGLASALFITHSLGGLLAKILPHDETSAVSPAQFLGQLAVITEGVARQGMSAEALLVDAHGQSHYLRVEPVNDIRLQPGSEVLLLERKEAVFLVVPSTDVMP